MAAWQDIGREEFKIDLEEEVMCPILDEAKVGNLVSSTLTWAFGALCYSYNAEFEFQGHNWNLMFGDYCSKVWVALWNIMHSLLQTSTFEWVLWGSNEFSQFINKTLEMIYGGDFDVKNNVRLILSIAFELGD